MMASTRNSVSQSSRQLIRLPLDMPKKNTPPLIKKNSDRIYGAISTNLTALPPASFLPLWQCLPAGYSRSNTGMASSGASTVTLRPPSNTSPVEVRRHCPVGR